MVEVCGAGSADQCCDLGGVGAGSAALLASIQAGLNAVIVMSVIQVFQMLFSSLGSPLGRVGCHRVSSPQLLWQKFRPQKAKNSRVFIWKWLISKEDCKGHVFPGEGRAYCFGEDALILLTWWGWGGGVSGGVCRKSDTRAWNCWKKNVVL